MPCITIRIPSSARWLKRDAALLELLARLFFNFSADLSTPTLTERHRLARNLGLHIEQLGADRRLVEGTDGRELLDAELLRVKISDLLDQLAFAVNKLGRELGKNLGNLRRLLRRDGHKTLTELLGEQRHQFVELLGDAGRRDHLARSRKPRRIDGLRPQRRARYQGPQRDRHGRHQLRHSSPNCYALHYLAVLVGGVAIKRDDPPRSGNDGPIGNAEEQAILHYPRHQLQRLIERLRILDLAEGTVENEMALIGDE